VHLRGSSFALSSPLVAAMQEASCRDAHQRAEVTEHREQMLAGEGLSSGQSGTIPARCQVALCPRDLLAGAGASRWAPEPRLIRARACLLVIGGSDPPAGPLQAFAARLACPRIPR
jgi:hypothetical protein